MQICSQTEIQVQHLGYCKLIDLSNDIYKVIRMYQKDKKIAKNDKKDIVKEVYNVKLENIKKMIAYLKSENKK